MIEFEENLPMGGYMNPQECEERVILGLIQYGLLQFGSFRWNIHERHPELPPAPFYTDLHKLQSCTVRHHGHSLLNDVVNLYDFALARHGVSIQNVKIAGVPVAAIPITLPLAIQLGVPHITPRLPKTHGSGSPIDGIWHFGDTVILGDDVMNAGGSKVPHIITLRNNGIQVNHVVVLIDYEAGGRDLLWRKYRVRTVACMSIRTLMNRLCSMGIIKPEEQEKALSFNRLIREVVRRDSMKRAA